MKKAISLFLALVMCLSLCACGTSKSEETTDTNKEETTESASKGTDLTLENYKDYFKITTYFNTPSGPDTGSLSVGNLGNGYGIPYDGGSTLYLGEFFRSIVNVAGVSSNFVYEDVVLTVKVHGKYHRYDFDNDSWDDGNNILEEEIVVDCNIAGEGNGSKRIDVTPYVFDKMADVSFEVVSISGRVVPTY